MTVATWPACLPAPQRDGYALAPTDLAVRAPGAGPAVSRLRSSRPMGSIALRWMMSDAELAIFDALWYWTLGRGTQWSDLPLRTADGLVTVRGRISGPYTAAMVGLGRWTVTATLETDGAP